MMMKTRHSTRCVTVVALTALLLIVGAGRADTRASGRRRAQVAVPARGAVLEVAFIGARQVPAPSVVAAGRALFATHCAACHGPNGLGGGPVAPELRHEVPDLTRFAMRNGGVFPSVRVQRIIDGTGVASHGTREMPVWGDVFVRSGASDALVAARIEALTRFLEAIQERAGE